MLLVAAFVPRRARAQNAPPVITVNEGITLLEGGSAPVDASVLTTTDADDPPADLVYTLETAPAHGTLERSGLVLVTSDAFTQQDIDDGAMSYVHDGSETLADAFDFTVSDGNGATISGTFAITVMPVNDPPIVVANSVLSVYSGGTATVTPANLSASDADNADAGLVFTLTAAPAHGMLAVSGTTLTTGGTFTQQDIDDLHVTYTHGGDAAESDAMELSVSDPDGGVAGPISFIVEIDPDPTAVRAPAGGRTASVYVYPNPSSLAPTVRYTVKRAGPVSLRVYDAAGRLVATLIDGEHRAPGPHTVPFRADVPSGVYWVRLDTATSTRAAKLLVLK